MLIVVALVTVLAAGVLYLELFIRAALLYVGALLGVVVYSGLVDRNLWGHVRRWAGIMIAVILVKPVIVIVLGLAGALTGEKGPNAFSAVVTGLAIILLAIFASAMIYRFVPGFGDEIASARSNRSKATDGAQAAAVISSPASLVSQGIKTHSSRGAHRGGDGGGGNNAPRPANPSPEAWPPTAAAPPPAAEPAADLSPPPHPHPARVRVRGTQEVTGVDDPVPPAAPGRAPPHVSHRPGPAERDRRKEPRDRRDRPHHRRGVLRHDERTARPRPHPAHRQPRRLPHARARRRVRPVQGPHLLPLVRDQPQLQAHPAPRHHLPLRRHGSRRPRRRRPRGRGRTAPGIGRISWLAAPFGPDEIAVLLHADRRTVTAAIEIEGPGVGLRDSEDQEALVDRFGTLLKHVANGDGFVTRLQMLARTLPADPDAHAKDVAMRGDTQAPGWLRDSYDQLQSMVSTSSEQHRAYLVACMHYTRDLAAEAVTIARAATPTRAAGSTATPASPSSWPASSPTSAPASPKPTSASASRWARDASPPSCTPCTTRTTPSTTSRP